MGHEVAQYHKHFCLAETGYSVNSANISVTIRKKMQYYMISLNDSYSVPIPKNLQRVQALRPGDVLNKAE